MKLRNKHHLVPRSRCRACSRRSNILLIGQYRHVYWHKMFGNMTLDEVINLLERVRRAKSRQRS